MSSSVIVARTLIWRTIVAIMRGGNFWGAAWHRPQLARNLFSPSTRIVSASAELRTTFSVELLLRGDAAAIPIVDMSAKSHKPARALLFIPPPVRAARQSGMRCLLSIN